MAKAACIVSSGIAPGAALEGLLSRENITLAAVDLLCGEHKNKEERKYEVVLVASSSQQSRETLASAARSLVPGGRLYVFEEASVSGNRFEALQRDLLLSGFTEAKQLSDEGSSQPLWVGILEPLEALTSHGRRVTRVPPPVVRYTCSKARMLQADVQCCILVVDGCAYTLVSV